MLKTGVEQTERNMKGLLFIPFWEPNSKKLPRKLLCVHQIRKLFENFLN